jgi:cytochrome P450
VGGTVIKAGTQTLVILAAANRDPAQFLNPDNFDITRKIDEHLGFGHGIHYCLGAALARMEGAIAINAVLDRFSGLRLEHPDAELQYNGSYFLRALAELPMLTG